MPSKNKKNHKNSQFRPNNFAESKNNMQNNIKIERLDEKTVAFTANKNVGGKIVPHIGLVTSSFSQGFESLEQAFDAAGKFTYNDVALVSSDVIVKSYMNKLLGKANAIKRSFDWSGVKPEVVDFIQSLWAKLKWDELNRYVFSSKYYGNSVIQILWENVGVELIGDTVFPAGQRIVGFRQENPENFAYNTDKEKGEIGDLIFKPDDINYTQKYPYNFIVIRNNPDFNHREGQSDIAELKPLVMFKNMLYKIKARYFRKSVIPSFVGIFETDKTGAELEAEATLIATQLAQVENGTGVAMPNVKNIIPLEPNKQVNFETAEELINKQIAIRILGTDLLSSTAKSTFASAKVGTEQFQDAVKELALTLQEWNNVILKLSVQNEFGVSEVIPLAIFDMTEKFDIDVFRFMMEAGIPVSWEELNKTFPLPRGIVAPKDDAYYWDNAQINRVVEKATDRDSKQQDRDKQDEDKREQDKNRKDDKSKEETQNANNGK